MSPRAKRYVAAVLSAIESGCHGLSLTDYILALDEIYSDIDSRIDAAKDDAERAKEGGGR